MSNVKNYIDQGGDKWTVGGTLEVTADGLFCIDGIKLTRAEVQATSSATTVSALKDEFNDLIEKLKAAGLMKQE